MTVSKASKTEAAYKARLPAVKALSEGLVGPSLAEELCALPEAARDAILDSLAPADFLSLWIEWGFWSRPKQQPPWELLWRWMLYLAGRGSGKSRTGAEFVRYQVEHGAGAVGLLGPTYNHVINHMLGGRKGRKGNGSGLLDVFPETQRPRLYKADKIVEFYTGAVAYVFTGEDEELRGPNLDCAWIDEPIKIARIGELFDNLEFTMRADDVEPRGIITTTPKPIAWLKETFARDDVYVVMGSSDENRANLARSFFTTIERQFGDGAVARQERHGEIVEDEDGQLFKLHDIEEARVDRAPPLVKIYVSLDPAATDSARADEVGIVGVGIDARGELYVLADASGKLSPEGYGDAAIDMYFELRPLAREVAILVEDNKLGKHGASTVRAAMHRKRGVTAALAVPIEEIHALGDKASRAHPVSVLYAKHLVHHVGQLPHVENELIGWRPGRKSPGRMDAITQAGTKLANLDQAMVGPAEDPTTVHAESRWNHGADPARAVVQTSEEWEADQDAGDGGAWSAD